MKKLGEKIGIKWENVAFTRAQFEKGVKAEMEEHHDDPETKVINTKAEAGKVAWAHLKEDPKYYDKLAKMEENTDPIFTKIEEGTVTVDDFNKFILEATPESVRDRVRRRTIPAKKRHLDDDEHSTVKGPKFAGRVQPKRKPSGKAQMHGRGKQAHRQSTRTQTEVEGKFAESVRFIKENVGKPIVLDDVQDKATLNKLAARLMTRPNEDRDWLLKLVKATQ